jgi:hypothetical protein
MFIELTTGKDSFRAQGGSAMRNTSVSTFVRVDDDGEGRKVVPLFSAYQKKLRGFRDTSLVATMPATSSYDPALSGTWYRNRHEVLPGTEILIEHRRRTGQGFSERIEYLMLVADEDAPLYRIRLDLPHHHLSAVPCIFFEGRFTIVETDDQLPEHAPQIWRDYLGLEPEFDVADLLDPNQEEKFYVALVLEAAIKRMKKSTVIEDSDGKKRIKIRRTRKINLR